MTKYHLNEDGLWLRCVAEKGKCPFGANADKTIPQIVTEAIDSQKSGKPLPTLKDNAGNVRSFTFNDDGSYTFGARSYDSDGELIPSDRTLKKYRHQEARVADGLRGGFANVPVERKIRLVGPDLIRHETTTGLLAGTQRGTGIRFTDWRDYTREHHRGMFSWFFKSEWKLTPKEDNLTTRYRLTLEGMFGKVKAWVLGSAARHAA